MHTSSAFLYWYNTEIWDLDTLIKQKTTAKAVLELQQLLQRIVLSKELPNTLF